jgi:hypothetical protein
MKIPISTKNLVGISSRNLNLAAFFTQCFTVFLAQSIYTLGIFTTG